MNKCKDMALHGPRFVRRFILKNGLSCEVAHLGKKDFCFLQTFSLKPNCRSGERRKIFKEQRNLGAFIN